MAEGLRSSMLPELYKARNMQETAAALQKDPFVYQAAASVRQKRMRAAETSPRNIQAPSAARQRFDNAYPDPTAYRFQ